MPLRTMATTTVLRKAEGAGKGPSLEKSHIESYSTKIPQNIDLNNEDESLTRVGIGMKDSELIMII